MANIGKQRREFQRSRLVVNLHRVKNVAGRYHPHLSLITLIRDARNKLAFLSGIDYRVPADATISTAALQHLLPLIQQIIESLSPLCQLFADFLRKRSAPGELADPFFQIWRCGNFVISPSQFQMIRTDDNARINLSDRQARFIALLLGARTFVERTEYRRTVNCGKDPMLQSIDKSIDRLVSFFRRHLGQSSIGTIRGRGHILTIERHVCEGDELVEALSSLWWSSEEKNPVGNFASFLRLVS